MANETTNAERIIRGIGDALFPLTRSPQPTAKDAEAIAKAIAEHANKFAGCMFSAADFLSFVAPLCAERDAAAKVIEKLPKTADGVAVVPGQTGWMNIYANGRRVDTVRAVVASVPSAHPANENVVIAHAGYVFSTAEAALAAAAAGEGKNG